jgi:hypothetical protein
MTIESLLRKIQSEINKIWKLDPDKVDPITYKQYLDKARVMGYLCSVGGQLLEKHDLEKRLESSRRIRENRRIKAGRMKQIRMEKRLTIRRGSQSRNDSRTGRGDLRSLAWGMRLYSLQELTILKNKLKERHEQRMKRFEPVDIQSSSWNYGENPRYFTSLAIDGSSRSGITYWIIVGISEGDDEIDESTDQEDPE